MPFSSINDNSTNSRFDLRNRSDIISRRHQIHRKRQKKVQDCSQKSIDGFKLIVLNTPPKLTGKEKLSIFTAFFPSSKYKGIETIAKIIMTCVLKRCN